MTTAVLEWRSYADDAGADDELRDADFLVAADCVYDDVATEALFDAARTAMARRPARRLLVALEKRFNFELESLSVRAHGYRTFRRRLADFTAEQLPLPKRYFHYDRGDPGALELWLLRPRAPRARAGPPPTGSAPSF